MWTIGLRLGGESRRWAACAEAHATRSTRPMAVGRYHRLRFWVTFLGPGLWDMRRVSWSTFVFATDKITFIYFGSRFRAVE